MRGDFSRQSRWVQDHQSSLILELRAVSTKTQALISSKIKMSGTSTSAISPARKTVCRAETK